MADSSVCSFIGINLSYFPLDIFTVSLRLRCLDCMNSSMLLELAVILYRFKASKVVLMLLLVSM